MLEEKTEIEKIKHSSATNFTAEVFFEELKFILQSDLDENFLLQSHGMNSRAMSKDVLDVTYTHRVVGDIYKEYLVLHVGRNSIYHELPEVLFHPLVIRKPGMSNREVVEAVRENRRREKENIDFFVPFDTALFKEKVKINNRHLNFLTDKSANENFFKIAQALLNVKLDISKQAIYKLFLNLCKSEKLKENLPGLENLLNIVLGTKSKIKYIPKILKNTPYKTLGNAILSINSGCGGDIRSEIDDIEVTILLQEDIDVFEKLKKQINTIKTILGFFILSSRDIYVQYYVEGADNSVLGNNYLGYNTYLHKENALK